MTFITLIDDDGHSHRSAWQASLSQQLALKKLEVLAISRAVLGEVPAIRDAPMVAIWEGSDRLVHSPVHLKDGAPGYGRQSDYGGLRSINPAFGRIALAELGPGRNGVGLTRRGDQFRCSRNGGDLLRQSLARQ